MYFSLLEIVERFRRRCGLGFPWEEVVDETRFPSLSSGLQLELVSY